MADEITQVAFYMAAIPNKAGEGARILGALKDAGVNLVGFLGYRKSARNAEVIIVVDDKAPNLGPIGKKAGVALGKRSKALWLTGEDRAGVGADVLSKLAGAGVNVVSLHGITAGAGRVGALLVVEPADFKKTLKALA